MADLHPSVIIGVLVLALVYAGAIRYHGRKVTRAQALSFAAGLIVMLFALTGPLDELEDRRLFAAHMAQHLLLGLVMPPLLLLGLTEWMVSPVLLNRYVKPVARLVLNPLIAFTLYNGAVVLIHMPSLYDLMCRNDDVHIAFHLVIMVTGLIAWWPLLGVVPEFPRLSYPGQLLYVFAMLIPMAAIAAPITLADKVIYPWYLEGPHPFGISPMADQALGGMEMWVGAGFYEICVATVIFSRWARFEDRDDPMIGRTPRQRPHQAHRPDLRPVSKSGASKASGR